MPDIIQQIREKLQSGENAEVLHTLLPELFKQYDDGLIPVLPCKVGEPVFRKGRFSDTVVSSAVHSIIINRFGITMKAETQHNCFSFNDDDTGKTVFLSKEAAEKALKEQSHEK